MRIPTEFEVACIESLVNASKMDHEGHTSLFTQFDAKQFELEIKTVEKFVQEYYEDLRADKQDSAKFV